jgi:hypothetical protein
MAKVVWQTIAVKLPHYDEPTLERMLAEEITTYKRVAIAQRLHQRLSKLRTLRERKDIVAQIKNE